ncbi:hypothetical protein PG994_005255 [Apiospora phragmitis]|uniref:Uncharacterized protein n=1 Tax=Apiospora phragmitis TaxID=2905665 RepID=A0ABR1VSW4_9PEZI
MVRRQPAVSTSTAAWNNFVFLKDLELAIAVDVRTIGKLRKWLRNMVIVGPAQPLKPLVKAFGGQMIGLTFDMSKLGAVLAPGAMDDPQSVRYNLGGNRGPDMYQPVFWPRQAHELAGLAAVAEAEEVSWLARDAERMRNVALDAWAVDAEPRSRQLTEDIDKYDVIVKLNDEIYSEAPVKGSKFEDSRYSRGEIMSLDSPQVLQGGSQAVSSTMQIPNLAGLLRSMRNAKQLISCCRDFMGSRRVDEIECEVGVELALPTIEGTHPRLLSRHAQPFVATTKSRQNMQAILTGYDMLPEKATYRSWMHGPNSVTQSPPGGPNDVLFVQGPAGTGKTQEAAVAILSAAASGERVVATAYSNASTCSMVAKLSHTLSTVTLPKAFPPILFVHYQHVISRVHEMVSHIIQAQASCSVAFWVMGMLDTVEHHLIDRNARSVLEELIKDSAMASVVLKAKALMEKRDWDNALQKTFVWNDNEKDRNHMVHLLHTMANMVIRRADILAVTINSAQDSLVKSIVHSANLVVIDEAAQAPAGSLLKVWNGQKLVIVGDYKQLPPAWQTEHELVMTCDGIKKPVNKLGFFYKHSILKFFLFDLRWPHLPLMVQYRMKEGLADWALKRHYKGINTENAAGPVPDDLQQMDLELSKTYGTAPSPTGKILPMFLHVPESKVAVIGASMSKKNDKQEEVCVELVHYLIDRGYKLEDIGVVAPYSAQVRTIQEIIHELAPSSVFIGTVDLFQGSDRKVVIYVMTGTRETGPGFAGKTERHVVATTRATDYLFVLGDKDILATPGPIAPSQRTPWQQQCAERPSQSNMTALRGWLDDARVARRIGSVDHKAGGNLNW